jgi:pullulanase/glycogen debranching enzyme
MKKTVLLFLLIISNIAYSQVSTVPVLPTANNEITIIFDATSTPLAGYTGDVYAHTGVTIGTNNWQNVIGNWGENSTQPKLTRDPLNSNKYTLLISPNVYDYYSVAITENITKLDFVFRASSGSPQSENIFVPLYEDGLNVTFTNPTDNSIYELNDNITIAAESSIEANLELFVNNVSEQTATSSTTISKPYTFTSTGLQTLKVTANTAIENAETEISVYVKTPTQNVTKPIGLKYGLNKHPDNSVTFLLQAPLKNDVFVIGEFNNWKLDPNYQLKKDGDDFWITISGLDETTEYSYQYVIDYDLKVADPYSEKVLDPYADQYIPEVTYPNLKPYPTGFTTGIVSAFRIKEDDYNWVIDEFQKPNPENLIVYELLIRDFTIVTNDNIGNYNEAIKHLDYLDSLGVNAIELMPISEFEGNDSWGYNPSFHNALDKAYGTKNDFKNFVDQCHQRGIAVILDVVYNHAFSQSPLAQMFWDDVNNKPTTNNPWLNVNSTHPYNVGNDFDHESEYTKTYVKQTMEHWLTEYKIDGFRFDLSKGFTQTYNPNNVIAWSQYDQSRIDILKEYAEAAWAATSKDTYLILEHFSDNDEETVLANFGFMLWGNSNHNYNQNTMGYSNESDISWMSYQKRGWNNPNVVGYMESHDEQRLMYKNLEYGNSNSDYNIKDLNTALSRQETASLFFLTIPGPKMIWQFGELGYDISIDYNGRTGRKPVRWDYEDNVNRKHIYNTWSTLIAFKKKYPEVFNTTTFDLNVGNTYSKTITLKDDSMDVVVVGNFDIVEKNVSTTFPKTGTWYEYFTGEELNVTSTSQTITLYPGGYKLYSTVKLLDPRGGTSTDDSDGDGVVDTEDMCPNTMEGIEVNSSGCPLFTLPSTNFKIETVGETCATKNNGKLKIVTEEPLNYSTTIRGVVYTFTNSLTVENLAPGSFDFCITVEGETFQQCYNATIEAGKTMGAKATVNANKVIVDVTDGTAPFSVLVNGTEIFETMNTTFSVDTNYGDIVEVKTSIDCEGIFSEQINNFGTINAYPNPTTGIITLNIPGSKNEVNIELYNMQSQLIASDTYPILFGKVQLNFENKPKGLYLVRVISDDIYTLKIIKQ